MLLAYVGMAADILEFYSEGVRTDKIRCEEMIILVILCLWAISLLQFAIELTHSMTKRSKSISQINETLLQRCQNSEVWAIIIIVMLQDGPFLCMRLMLIIEFQILEQGLIFFTFKNILVVLLQLYRLWILLCLTWDAVEGKFSFRLVATIHSNNPNRDLHSVSMGEENNAFENDDRRQSYPGGSTSRPQSPQPYNNTSHYPQEGTHQFHYNESPIPPYGRGNPGAAETNFGQSGGKLRPQSPLHRDSQPGHSSPPFDQGYVSQQVPYVMNSRNIGGQYYGRR